MSNEELKFRTDDKEREWIKERNDGAARRILEKAGVDPNDSKNRKWWALTLINVHNTGRFGTYNEDVEKFFVDILRDPEMTVEQYEKLSREYKEQKVKEQLERAPGGFAHWTSLDDTFEKLGNTVLSGIERRNENDIKFPKMFYDEDGNLQTRVVFDIPESMQDGSAMGMINQIVENNESIGLSFDKNENTFIFRGQKVGPERFFLTRKEMLKNKFLDKLETAPTGIDYTDKELFGVLEKGDWNAFSKLRAERGKNKDGRNILLRNALADPIIFREVMSRMAFVEFSSSELVNTIKEVAETFEANAHTVRKEAQKSTLDEIDTVVFSVNPYDLATQSTLRDWKSCMHTTGCNFGFVDDTIAEGSIVAYGYDSKNPQKMVSRLLIHPFYNEKGEVCYGVNNRIYGKENLGFRKAVDKVVEEEFNRDIKGLYLFNEKQTLYNDGNQGAIFKYDAKDMEGQELDVRRYGTNKALNLEGADLSGLERLILKDDMEIENIQSWPKNADFSDLETLTFTGDRVKFDDHIKFPKHVVFRDCKMPKDVSFMESVEIDRQTSKKVDISEVKLPKKVGFSYFIPEGVDLYQFDSLTFKRVDIGREDEIVPDGTVFENVNASDVGNIIGNDLKIKDGRFRYNVPNAEFSGNISLTDIELTENMDFSKCERLELYAHKGLSNFNKWAKTVDIYGSIREDADFRNCDKVIVDNASEISGDVKWPDKVNCYGVVPKGLDVSGIKDLTLEQCRDYSEDVLSVEKLTIERDYYLDCDLSRVKDLTLSNFGFADDASDLRLPENVTIIEGKMRDYEAYGAKHITFVRTAEFTEYEGDKWIDAENISFKEDCVIQVDGYNWDKIADYNMEGCVVVTDSFPDNFEPPKGVVCIGFADAKIYVPEGVDLREKILKAGGDDISEEELNQLLALRTIRTPSVSKEEKKVNDALKRAKDKLGLNKEDKKAEKPEEANKKTNDNKVNNVRESAER